MLMQKYNDPRCPWQDLLQLLNKDESIYSQLDTEALTIFFASIRFREYILWTKFKIKGIHKPFVKNWYRLPKMVRIIFIG